MHKTSQTKEEELKGYINTYPVTFSMTSELIYVLITLGDKKISHKDPYIIERANDIWVEEVLK